MKKGIATFLIPTFAAASFAAITIDPVSRTFAKDGGASAVLTQGSGSWTATTGANWITLSRASGDAGVSCVYIVNANLTADIRTGTIDIGGNTHTVRQTGYTASLDASSASFDWTGGGGTIAVTVDAGVSWSAAANADWLAVSPSSGTSGGSVTYTVAEYGGVTPRTGSLTIAGQTFTVTQTGRDVVLSPAFVEKEYGADIIQVTVSALASTQWAVTPAASWISVVDGGNGYGNSTILLAVGQNPSVQKRTGTVSIGSASLTVAQGGYDNPSLAITPETATAAATGAYGNVAVYATPDADWSAESLDSWITLTEGTPGAGNGNVKYVASANPDLVERTGRIKFTPPVVKPEVDYLAGLVVWCPGLDSSGTSTGSTIYGYDLASNIGQFGNYFSRAYDGTFKNTLSGIPSDCPTWGFRFKVGVLNTIHRLAVYGNQTVWIDADNYLVTSTGGRTSFQIDKTGTWYAVLINGTSAWAGKGGEGVLECVGTCSATTSTSISFGYADKPSSGYLSNANIWGFAAWNRTLTDKEASGLGLTSFPSKTDGKFPVATETAPLGSPSNVGYSHFPFKANTFFATKTSGSTPQFSYSTTGNRTDWSRTSVAPAADRFGLPNRAFGMTSASAITSENSNFGASTYLGSSYDATYNFWIRIDSLPTSGNHTIMNLDRYSYSDTTLSVSSTGNLVLGYNTTGQRGGANTKTFSPVLELGTWHMVSIRGDNAQSLVVFLDGEEIGNVATKYSGLGESYYYYDSSSYPARSISGLTTLTIGGWNGAIDEMTFFHSAFTSAQIKSLYSAGKPPVVYHTVTQGAVTPAVSPDRFAFGAEGGNGQASVTVAQNVNWTASSSANWISFASQTAQSGSGTVSFDVAQNPNVAARTAIVNVAGTALTVEQKGLAASVIYAGGSFGTDGGSDFIQVNVEGNAYWTAESKSDWISIVYGESGSNSGELMFVVDPVATTQASRTGCIRVAEQDVYITQCGYRLSIDPAVAEIGSNAGAGEFGVAAPIDAVWEALATESWITLTGGRTGIGNGTLHYTVADNTTGQTRTGRIIVAGQEYTITQLASYKLDTATDGEGSVSGAGNYDTNARATLTATPAAGYAFTHWSGDAVGVEPTVSFTMDTSKKVTAHFIPEGAAQRLAEEKAAQGGFYTRDQIHAMELGNLLFDVDSATGKARIGVQLQETSDLAHPDWKPVSVTAQDLDIGADGSVGINAPATGNAKFFRVVSGSGE